MTSSEIVIRPLRADDFPSADTIRRLAFGTLFGLSDPMTFRADQAPDRTRFLSYPAGSFAAVINDELVGTNFAVTWGSLGLVGPISVHPDYWNRGIAQMLMQPVLEVFENPGIRHVGLFTLAHSPMHIWLYQKFDFWPRFLTLIMSKPVTANWTRLGWDAYSMLTASQQQACLEQCRELSDLVYRGLDLSIEIQATYDHQFGETVLLRDKDSLAGFAVCHFGARTEGGSGNCYVKFGAVRPGPEVGTTFSKLLSVCETMAAKSGSKQLTAGVNTARREAYQQMLQAGFRTSVQGLAMDRPDEEGYNHPGVYVIDDWR